MICLPLALKVEHHGVSVKVGAVVEFDALAQVDGPHQAVVADRVAGSQCGDRGRALVLVLEQWLQDLAGDAEALAVGDHCRIELDRVAAAPKDERGQLGWRDIGWRHSGWLRGLLGGFRWRCRARARCYQSGDHGQCQYDAQNTKGLHRFSPPDF
jgi:hypothetical protein